MLIKYKVQRQPFTRMLMLQQASSIPQACQAIFCDSVAEMHNSRHTVTPLWGPHAVFVLLYCSTCVARTVHTHSAE